MVAFGVWWGPPGAGPGGPVGREAQAQVSPVSALWREVEALRVRWRVEAAALRIDVDRLRERVARKRFQLRRRQGGAEEP